MMNNKQCQVSKIENGFLVATTHDPNNYENTSMYSDYDDGSTFAPIERKTVFAGSPEELGAIVAGFYTNE